MRTLIDLPQTQLDALDAYCREERISRAEAVRRAVGRFVPAATAPKRGLREHPAFGSWRRRRINAVAYQRRLREEWPR